MTDYLSRQAIESMIEDPSKGIIGVRFKLLATHGDQRGFFREIFRRNERIFDSGSFAQWSHSCMQRNVVKAWHYHHVQFDWWYLPVGKVETVLIDFRQESPTYKKKLILCMGDALGQDEEVHQVCVRIPPGVLHGCRVLSDTAHLFYITSEMYNPNDEGRYPYNSPEVSHDWGSNAIVADNDRKRFIPTSPRSTASA